MLGARYRFFILVVYCQTVARINDFVFVGFVEVDTPTLFRRTSEVSFNK